MFLDDKIALMFVPIIRIRKTTEIKGIISNKF